MPEETAQRIILVIEDDDSIREIVTRVLEDEGFTVVSAVNGLRGLEKFLKTTPDLVLLDVKMPEMDGWETLQNIRKVSETPVVMLTVFGSTDDIIKGLEMGADDYLVKPFGVPELLVRVQAVLRRSTPV